MFSFWNWRLAEGMSWQIRSKAFENSINIISTWPLLRKTLNPNHDAPRVVGLYTNDHWGTQIVNSIYTILSWHLSVTVKGEINASLSFHLALDHHSYEWVRYLLISIILVGIPVVSSMWIRKVKLVSSLLVKSILLREFLIASSHKVFSVCSRLR